MRIDHNNKLAQLMLELENAHREIELLTRMNRQFRETESKFHVMFETIRDGIVRTDLKGHILEANPAYQEMLGYSEEELIKLTYLDLTPEKWLDWELNTIVKGQIIKRGYSDYYEKEYIRKSGEIFPVLIRSWLIRDKNGQPVGLWGIVRHIAEQKKADKLLRESERKYRWLFDSIRDGIALAEMNGRIVGHNRAFLDMMGYSEGELQRLTYMDITPPQWHRMEAEIMHNQVLARGYSELFEKDMIKKGGAIFPVAIRVWLARDDEGHPAGTWALIRDITERKEVEKALRASEKRFSDLFMNLSIAGVLFAAVRDTSGNFEDLRYELVNKMFVQITGFQPADIEGKLYSETFRSKSLDLFSEIAKEVLATGRARRIEYFSDITRRYYDMTVYRPADGRVTVLFDDITETKQVLSQVQLQQEELQAQNEELRITQKELEKSLEDLKRTSQALRRSENQYRTLFEQMISGFALHEIITDENGKPIDYRFIEVNSAFEKLTGLHRENIIGRRVTEVIPDIEPFWIERYGHVALTGEPIQFEDRSESLNKYYEIRAFSPERNLFAVIFNDVTEHIKAEAARQLSEERFRTLFTSMTSSVSLNQIVLDERDHPIDAIFLEVNPVFEALAGLKRENIIGKHESKIFPFFDREWIQVCGRVAETGRSEQMEQYIPPLDRYFHLTIYSPVKGQFAVIRKDITQERKFQQELVENRKELEQRMVDLKKANEELQRFAYVASHDLQEPLRMISSYLQLLERRYKDKLDRDAIEFIAFAVDGARRLQKMIESLLEYSRVETRGEPLHPVSLAEIWKQALKNMEVALKENDAVITNDELPSVMGDPSQLMRLLQNLIANALKFRSKEQPRINFSANRQENEWLLAIRDNGIGIDPKYFERIFVIFQRLHGHEYPGAGMGLSISKRIVERHGGRMWLESAPGRGSTFYFTLPVVPDSE